MPVRDNGKEVVVFTGPTGVEKSKVICGIVREFLRKEGVSPIPESDVDLFENRIVRAYIRVHSLENEIEYHTSKSLPTFLDIPDQEKKEKGWQDAFEKLCKKLENARKENVHIFIQLHSNYIRGTKAMNFFRCSDIKNLNATLFITLLDDIYSIYHRIKTREEDTHRSSYLTLEEINNWRAMEIKWSDFFARSCGIKNIIIPVKHPSIIFYRLIFERSKNNFFYASYPITGPRKGASEGIPITEGQIEINENRRKLYQLPLIVFDPVTIDERSLLNAYLEKYGTEILDKPFDHGNDEIELKSYHRWPLGLTEFPPSVPDPPELFPLILKAQEVRDVLRKRSYPNIGGDMRSLIDSQISLRDLRYIHEADEVGAYRPCWKGIISHGIQAELEYAKGRATINVYCPQEEKRFLNELTPVGPGTRFSVCDNLNKFYNSYLQS